jgi:predicted transposase YdaD
VLFLRVEKQILHLEFQTEAKSRPPLPLRLLDYYVRLKRKYNCSIRQVIIFLQQSNSPIVFQDQYQDENTIHKYQVIRLWEENPEEFLSQPILYPFAVLANTDQPEKLLGEVAQKINQLDDKDLLPELTTCTHILAGLKLDKDLIKSLLKEEIMQSSVTYQDIKLQGKIEGKREGKIEGKIEGKREEALNLSLKIINQYLGEIDEDLLSQIEKLPLEKLEELALTVFNFDCLGDLELWLMNQN